MKYIYFLPIYFVTFNESERVSNYLEAFHQTKTIKYGSKTTELNDCFRTK